MEFIRLGKNNRWAINTIIAVAFFSFLFSSTAVAQTIRWKAQDENPFESPTFKNLKIK